MKIFIYAYTQKNLGDDLFIKILCERYPKDTFYIVCNTNKKTPLKNIPNLVIFPGFTYLSSILKRILPKFNLTNNFKVFISKKCDAIVHIGGSIFIEPINLDRSIHEYRNRLIKNKPFFILGSNFGPYEDKKYYEGFKFIFEKVTDICFRDNYSYNLFSELDNVRQASDVILSYSLNDIKISEEKIVLISVIDLSKRKDLKNYKTEYEKKILELCRFYSKKKYKTILMSFCGQEGDEKAINRIINLMSKEEQKTVERYFYKDDIKEAMNILSSSKHIIATRFHSMIIGWLMKKKVYPVIYSDKSLTVMRDVGFSDQYANINDIESLSVESVFEYLESTSPLDVQKEIQSAENQFEKLDNLLT